MGSPKSLAPLRLASPPTPTSATAGRASAGCVSVTDVIDLLAGGLTSDQVLDELPDLEPEDIQAALKFASRRVAVS